MRRDFSRESFGRSNEIVIEDNETAKEIIDFALENALDVYVVASMPGGDFI